MVNLQGIPAGGFTTVGQIVGTNSVQFHPGQTGMDVAIELLSTHASGGPVVDGRSRLLGFVSEFDLLRAHEQGKDLRKVTVEEIMSDHPGAVHESTPIEEAFKLMEERHWLTLPVEKDGQVRYSVTRHDLLRACTGLGLGAEI